MWAKVDDRYYANPKIIAVGHWGRELHMASIVWVAGNAPLTGQIPTLALRLIGDWAGIPRNRHAVLAELLSRELVPGKGPLWEKQGDHWVLHDFKDYLPKELLSEQERHEIKAKAGRVGGKASAASKKQAAVLQESLSLYISSRVEGQADGNEFVADEAKAKPRPVPSPDSNSTGVASVDIAVFVEWRESTGKQQAHLLPKRLELIQARRKEGYTQDDLLDAVRGWVNDPWEGRKDELDLKYLIGSGERVEKFAGLWRSGKPVPEMTRPNGATARAAVFGEMAERLRDQKQLKEGT